MKNLAIIFAIIIFAFAFQSCNQEGANALATGKGGSMARFTVASQNLYVVDDNNLNVFSLENPSQPAYIKQIPVGFGIETIYPYQNYLFLGTQTGMYIMDNQEPSNPKVLSIYSHIRSCDPVVVQGNYAYVTMRRESFCNRGLQQLDVVSIADLKKPTLVRSYDMANPYGLGVDGNKLFVCDNGLKFFDASNPASLLMNNHISSINGFDVIPNKGFLLLTGSTGFFQYDYEGNLISSIPVENKNSRTIDLRIVRLILPATNQNHIAKTSAITSLNIIFLISLGLRATTA